MLFARLERCFSDEFSFFVMLILARLPRLSLSGVVVGPHSLQLVAAFLISSVETETGGSGHVAKQEAEILGAEAVRVVRR